MGWVLGVVLSLPTDGLTAEKIANHAGEADGSSSEGKVKSGTIATAIPATTEPELGEPRCPNGHDSAIPPRCPALMFGACHHYSTAVSWNEFCITCGIRHAPLAIYWRSYRVDGQVQLAKNYCGYCGARMHTVRTSR
jgi:hypothetical protein